MPSQKELRWSQLKVGALALGALTALTVLIFLLAGSTGGLFAKKLNLKAYFENASGLKDGSPVTLNGVTIGNVTSVRILPNHDPDSVEVTLRVGARYLPSLHTDSTVAINTAGVLGDSFLDISSVHATGPAPGENATLRVIAKPSIQDVVQSSQESIQAVNKVIGKVGILIDTLNAGKGTVGMLLNDPEVAKKVARTVDELQQLTQAIASGKGTIGKLINDNEMYDHANDTIAKLDDIAAKLDRGQGSAGKLLTEDGKGSVGQMFQNKSLYDNLDKTLNDTGQLITAIRKDPKTYLTIRVKVF